MKKNRGFTMAELLIVVAIIAVLVAIAIPVFSEQLEKAREGTDESALRNAYAEVITQDLMGNKTASVQVKQVQEKAGWTAGSPTWPSNFTVDTPVDGTSSPWTVKLATGTSGGVEAKK